MDGVFSLFAGHTFAISLDHRLVESKDSRWDMTTP